MRCSRAFLVASRLHTTCIEPHPMRIVVQVVRRHLRTERKISRIMTRGIVLLRRQLQQRGVDMDAMSRRPVSRELDLCMKGTHHLVPLATRRTDLAPARPGHNDRPRKDRLFARSLRHGSQKVQHLLPTRRKSTALLCRPDSAPDRCICNVTRVIFRQSRRRRWIPIFLEMNGKRTIRRATTCLVLVTEATPWHVYQVSAMLHHTWIRTARTSQRPTP